MPDEKAIAAAQPSSRKGPTPKAPQHHTWKTEEEYEAQIALDVHMINPDVEFVKDPKEGEPAFVYRTACGKQLAAELLRTTEDPDEVTCSSCKKKTKKK